MTVGLIVCGALGREVEELVHRHGWDAKVIGVSALDHLWPERIPQDVEARILALRDRYPRLIVVYGDCGTYGALDALLARHQIQRVAGPHCYEMYGGPVVQTLMDEEPGTFFLTDFLVRCFRGTVVKGLGLDQFPQLKDDYFHNYRRAVYLAQRSDPLLLQRAHEIALYLGLSLEVRQTGYGLLEERLLTLLADGSEAPPS